MVDRTRLIVVGGAGVGKSAVTVRHARATSSATVPAGPNTVSPAGPPVGPNAVSPAPDAKAVTRDGRP
ncbi:hypothetical protein GCM10017673_27860 [Streptosporangium violaceochromogenes]|nr:hypothetical protein GCM10017673_27860 [Streptosporangium violaceochromogenes]